MLHSSSWTSCKERYVKALTVLTSHLPHLAENEKKGLAWEMESENGKKLEIGKESEDGKMFSEGKWQKKGREMKVKIHELGKGKVKNGNMELSKANSHQ